MRFRIISVAIIRCTSGFSVEDSDGTKGITTAGHCGNDLSYDGTELDFEEEELGGSYDIQWFSDSGFTVVNKIQSSSTGGTREITGTVGRNSQAVGAYVCKYGKATHYTCGYISDKDFLPASTPPASATFIRVNNTAGYPDLSSGGDSGGPWFHLNNAYGTHDSAAGDDPNDGIYMAVNYISSGIGVDVITSDLTTNETFLSR